MRLGADGVTYPTAGEAQRTQFNAKMDKSAIVQTTGNSKTEVMSQDATTNEFNVVYSALAKRTYNQFNKFNYRVKNNITTGQGETYIYENSTWMTICFDVNVSAGELIQFYNPVVLSDFGVSAVRATLLNKEPIVGETYISRVDIASHETEYRGYVVATENTTKATVSLKFDDVTDENERLSIFKAAVDTLCVSIIPGATSPRYYDYPYIDYYIPDVSRECFDDETNEEMSKNVRHTGELVVRHGGNRTSNGVVTLGNGWSGSITDGFTHVAGSVEPVEISGMFWSGDWILVTTTNSKVNYPRQVFVSVGDGEIVDTYFGKATTTVLLKCYSGVLKITPASSYSGTIKIESVNRLSSAGTEETTLNLDTFHYGDAIPQIGWWNVLLGGENSFRDAVAVTRSIAIGSYAFDKIQYGSRHVAIGTYAMRQLIEGERNVSIGADSMYQVKRADDNIAIGMDSNGSAKDETNRNVSIGNYSMVASKEGSEENVSIGHYAGRYANKRNTYLGMRAGYFANGNGNVAIGAYCMGGSTEHGGDNNTFIGANVQNTDDVVNGSTAIGKGATATKSNQFVAGGNNITETLLKGDLIVRATDGTMKQIVFNSDGTLGWAEVE